MDDEMFCAIKNPAKGLYTALKGKYTNKQVKQANFLIICPYIFSRALAKDSEDPDKCLKKAMTNVNNKLTKRKTEILTIIVP